LMFPVDTCHKTKGKIKYKISNVISYVNTA
jgi:hypothetical protein